MYDSPGGRREGRRGRRGGRQAKVEGPEFDSSGDEIPLPVKRRRPWARGGQQKEIGMGSQLSLMSAGGEFVNLVRYE